MKLLLTIAVGISLLCSPLLLSAQDIVVNNIAKWFPKYDFEIAKFQKPALEFGPFARWWWPGNNVEKEELKKEINLFADNKFGGLEIQPMAQLFVPGTKEARAKVNTWDTPDYYLNVIAVMQESRKRGLTIDMTDGSGWPPGGYFLSDSDGFLSLESNYMDVLGGGTINMALPIISNNSNVPSKLQAVIAAKIKTKNPNDKSNTILLDPSSVVILTYNVKNDSLHWSSPFGNWKIIAFWSKPAGQKTMSASTVQGPVVDHFDSVKVFKMYDHLFGKETGLQPYFGNPMRSVFNDSYEFTVNRHFSAGFIDYFKKHRGYDIIPWLPAEMQRGYNFVAYMRPKTDPDFSFSDQDWRLKYDYDLTLSELLGKQFIKASKDWLEARGLLHRTQAYGLNLDMIAEAGLASIPETESMLGPEANIKIMTSGGHLYNKPIISAESVVFNSRAYTITPQKIKIAVDKLFAAGVNQIIYHGVPYHYTPTELGPEGWYPFSMATFGSINFSSNLGEGNIFWKYQKEVNEYISRTQYALRSGKPHADVLIYYPFMNVEGIPENPEEIMALGYLQGVEGPLPVGKESKNTAKEAWAKIVYPLINQLEANGITWDWVNDPSIQAAQLDKNKQIDIRGNIYQALILADDSVIQLKSAQAINVLAGKGMKLMAIGTLPYMQPSFLNWKENDKKTASAISAALKKATARYIQNEMELGKWMKELNISVTFKGQFHFTRQAERNMSDGSRIQFIWNKSDQWQPISLSLDKKFLNSYWINADGGTILKNRSSIINYVLPPYASVFLYASTKKINLPGEKPFRLLKSETVISLDEWNLKADSVMFNKTALFDWRTNDQLKYSSAEGIYTSQFQWQSSVSGGHYCIDLGNVASVATVFINGKEVGTRIFAPYRLDISSFLTPGNNEIEIRVTTGQLNGFIGKARTGDPHYKQFRNKEDQIMSAGLIGPVKIVSLSDNETSPQ
jgi:alpha-L-rhamnosidase